MQDRSQGFGISPCMQELMTYAGHLDCYGRCEEIMEKFTSVKVSPSRIYRVTDFVSESLKEEDRNAERTLKPLSKNDVPYVEIDGSMIPTRMKDEPWKEVKPGRLFRDSDCLNPNTDTSYMLDSQYVGHFGNSADFCEKLKGVIDSYGDLKDRPVFISDGAAWIREWIADCHPVSTSILDFYHAMEYLYTFAATAFAGDCEKKQWCNIQKELILASNAGAVPDNIRATNAREEHKNKPIKYCQNNKHRMKYRQYRNIGCGIIGSGGIESAHRTVIQKRMKLSGQRWSHEGAKNMLRLRVISMNKQWAKVVNILKSPITIKKCA
jgi:hypothetical protein